MNANRLSPAEIRDALCPAEVLDYFGIAYARRGSELRTSMCPACGQRSRDSVCVEAASGLFHCKVCGARGDVFTLIGRYAGETSFAAARTIAMQIAGLSDTRDPEMERRLAERRRQADERRRRERADLDALRSRLAQSWERYALNNEIGARYLDSRGIPSTDLRHVVRYSEHGYPALPLRDLATGAIVGIQHRHTEPGADPKIHTVTGSQVAGSALSGRLSDLAPEGADVAVLVEGLADTLVAHLAFPGCAVFGAPGADQLETIARAVAPQVVEARGCVLLVPDNDDGGIRGAAKAVRAAERSGLELDRDLLLVDLGEHHDLADAWRAGWRWRRLAPQGVST